MLTVPCRCGEVFQADERFIGRAIKCWRCGEVLLVGAAPTSSPAGTGSGPRSLRRWGIGGGVVAIAAIVWIAVSLQARGTDPEVSSKPPSSARVESSPKAVAPAAPPAAARPTPLPRLSFDDMLRIAEDTPPSKLPKAQPRERAAPVPPSGGGSTQSPRFVLEPDQLKAKPPATRPKNGTEIWTPVGPSGHGTLRINNGTRHDAAVTLLDADTATARRFVYLRAREAITLEAVAPCQCRLFFALGTGWDALTEEFREDPSYSVFDSPLRFTESETAAGVEYATFSVTLHPIPEGRAKTTRLSKEEFERQLGKRQSRKGV